MIIYYYISGVFDIYYTDTYIFINLKQVLNNWFLNVVSKKYAY